MIRARFRARRSGHVALYPHQRPAMYHVYVAILFSAGCSCPGTRRVAPEKQASLPDAATPVGRFPENLES